MAGETVARGTMKQLVCKFSVYIIIYIITLIPDKHIWCTQSMTDYNVCRSPILQISIEPKTLCGIYPAQHTQYRAPVAPSV